jgi:hypothetical protein
MFGQQVGTKSEEGIADADDEREFEMCLHSLKVEWTERIGQEGLILSQLVFKEQVTSCERTSAKTSAS